MSKTNKDTRLFVRLPESDLNTLKERAIQENLTVSELVRSSLNLGSKS